MNTALRLGRLLPALLMAALLASCGDSGRPSASALGMAPGSPTTPGSSGGGTAALPTYGTKTITEDGYLTVADGTRLRYHWERAEAAPPGPVILQYDGYDAGTGDYFSDVPELKARLLPRGYTFLGLSIRGTGCSTGAFSLFDPVWAEDGAEAVEWAARQPWSNGNIGMTGYSYPGIMQLFVAAQRPPHLKAIAPSSVVFDTYRDVSYPGGIPNQTFITLFTAQQQYPGAESVPGASQAGDADCGPNNARSHAEYESFALGMMQSPYIDGPFDWPTRSASTTAARINIPVLTVVYWQDEQTGSRVGGITEPQGLLGSLDISRTWAVLSNGNHDLTAHHPLYIDAMEDFYERYLGGVANGWEQTPRVQLLHEMSRPGDRAGWITSFNALPAPRPVSLYLRAGESLLLENPPAGEAANSYAYPLPSPSTHPLPDVADDAENVWQTPTPAQGRLVFTTPRLAQDVQTFGSASLDIWLSSTASDTDLQATISEVRLDGQEVFVQRGWLRASKRALDAGRSTATRPLQSFLEASAANLVPGTPTFMRLEVFPFAQRFRAGSALRLIIDAPTEAAAGNWGFAFNPTPAMNTVLHDAGYPSKLVIGLLPDAPASVPAAAACGTLISQACRNSIAAVPEGEIRLAP